MHVGDGRVGMKNWMLILVNEGTLAVLVKLGTQIDYAVRIYGNMENVAVKGINLGIVGIEPRKSGGQFGKAVDKRAGLFNIKRRDDGDVGIGVFMEVGRRKIEPIPAMSKVQNGAGKRFLDV